MLANFSDSEMNCADYFGKASFQMHSALGVVLAEPSFSQEWSWSVEWLLCKELSVGVFREALAAGTSLDSAVVFIFTIPFDMQHARCLSELFLSLVYINFQDPKDCQIHLLSKTENALLDVCTSGIISLFFFLMSVVCS